MEYFEIWGEYVGFFRGWVVRMGVFFLFEKNFGFLFVILFYYGRNKGFLMNL